MMVLAKVLGPVVSVKLSHMLLFSGSISRY